MIHVFSVEKHSNYLILDRFLINREGRGVVEEFVRPSS